MIHCRRQRDTPPGWCRRLISGRKFQTTGRLSLGPGSNSQTTGRAPINTGARAKQSEISESRGWWGRVQKGPESVTDTGQPSHKCTPILRQALIHTVPSLMHRLPAGIQSGLRLSSRSSPQFPCTPQCNQDDLSHATGVARLVLDGSSHFGHSWSSLMRLRSSVCVLHSAQT